MSNQSKVEIIVTLVKALNHIVIELKQKIHIVKKINLIINIDGLPLSKSNKSSFGPIMCSDLRLTKTVFIVGIFHEYEKLKSSNEFLEEFISELIPLVNEGLITSEGEVICVNLVALICDITAKSFVLHIKSHNGYNSCSKCIITGTYIRTNGIHGKFVFHHQTKKMSLFLDVTHCLVKIITDCQNGVSILTVCQILV